jgi:hypothetical protein
MFTQSNREYMQVLGRGVSLPTHRKHIRSGFAPADFVQEVPSYSVKVPCGGAWAWRAAAGRRAEQAPCTPRAVLISSAQNNLVHPMRIPS